MEILINEIERLPEAAAQFIDDIENHGGFRDRVFAFDAPMGAGKTTFISEVCRQLGSEDEASSPTFSIVNQYDTRRWGTVYHLDCYRLETEEEAFDIGVEDYFASGSPCFIEWPDRLGQLLPYDALRVRIEVDHDGSRRVIYEDQVD